MELKVRERAAILAALHYWLWQREGAVEEPLSRPQRERLQSILAIENVDNTVKPLTDTEIDELCKRFGDTSGA
jgi:hypothetical protein